MAALTDGSWRTKRGYRGREGDWYTWGRRWSEERVRAGLSEEVLAPSPLSLVAACPG